MSENIGSNLQPLHEVFVIDPSDTPIESEHTTAIHIAKILVSLDLLNRHYDHSYDERMDDTEAQRLRLLVEDTYHSYFSDQTTDDYAYPKSPLEGKIDTIENHLRGVWVENYYMPRTQDATKEDFQGWLNGYVAAYGEKALFKTSRVDADFLDSYRPFRNPVFKRGKIHDLRTSTSDLMLIPGCGSNSVKVIEGDGTTVKRALPHAFDHHTVYTLRTSPDEWFGHISVPNDIKRPQV